MCETGSWCISIAPLSILCLRGSPTLMGGLTLSSDPCQLALTHSCQTVVNRERKIQAFV